MREEDRGLYVNEGMKDAFRVTELISNSGSEIENQEPQRASHESGHSPRSRIVNFKSGLQSEYRINRYRIGERR